MKKIGITQDTLYLIWINEETHEFYLEDCCGRFYRKVLPEDKDWQYKSTDIFIGDMAFRKTK